MSSFTESKPDKMPALTEPHVVMDGGRSIRFTGALIAFASSQRPHAPRYTEFRLYRTSKNMYVISRIGCSLVFHTNTCRQADNHRLPYGNELDIIPNVITMHPCPICKPSKMDDPRGLRFERERPWAGVADNAHSVVAMMTDSMSQVTNGRQVAAKQIPQLSARLLTLASEVDPDIKGAYMTLDLT